MGGRVPLFEAVKAFGQKLLTDAGWLSRPGQLAAAASLASALIGVVTGMVTSQRGWGLAGGVITLGVLIPVAMVVASRQAEQVSVDVLAGEVVTGTTRYGVVRFPTGTGIAPGRLLGTVMSSTYGEFTTGSAEPGSVVNLKNERDELKKFLKADQSKVILVHGPPGAGKSTLVHAVLQEMGLESKARLHDLASGDRLDAKALLDDIESGPRAGAGLKPGEDLLCRLELAMEARRGSPVTIVVDGASSLFEQDNHMDDQLAGALEVITKGRRQVKVILIVQERPVPGTGGSWHGTAYRVFVGGLRRKDFNDLLEGLNPAFEFGLTGRTATGVDGLYYVLQGNPRQAEMFCAALGLSESQLSADELARMLVQKQPEERGRLLASAVVDSLSQNQRRVVAALAAYGIPVTIEHLYDLLVEIANDPRARKLSADEVVLLVSELVNWHVIGRVTGKEPDRYYLPAPEICQALVRSKDLNVDLLINAVEKLSQYQMPEERIQGLEDLRWYFAELDILLREAPLDTAYPDPWEPLYGEINRIQPIMERALRRWNAEGLLFKYRVAIKGKLGEHPYREMVNSNALGCIYMSRGRFHDARQAFDDALRHASDAMSSDGLRKILINLAALSWNSGDTSAAKAYYGEALDYNTRDPAKAAEHTDALDLVAAEAGLADCYRRWGRYGDAIDHGMRALSVAQDRGSPSSVDIAVKLARWLSELNQREEAGRLMKVADRAAGHDPALRVHCLAGHAGLLLDAGYVRRARRVAKKALKEALKLRDTVTVLRASPVLAMACLMLRDIRSAKHAIDRASQCGREGRSLDVLALRALIAFRSNPDGEEARGLFAELKDEADQRMRNDERDFMASDFKGLAFCGMYVRGTASLDGAVKEFRHAREHVSAPGLDTQVKRWLEALQARAAPGRLDSVMAVINGAAAS